MRVEECRAGAATLTGWLNQRAAAWARETEDGERESERGKCLPFCTALKGDIVPAIPLRMPASKPPLGCRLH